MIVPLLLRIQDRNLGICVPQKCTPHQLSSLPLEPHHLLYRNFFQINIYFGYNFEKRVYVLTSTDFASCEKKPDIVWSVLYFNISILYLHQSSSLLFCFMFTQILSVWYIWNGNVCDKVPYVNLLKWSSDLVIIPT